MIKDISDTDTDTDTDTDWSDKQKVKYFSDLVYGMNNCCECEDIEMSFSEVEGVYIVCCLRDNEWE